MIAALKNFNANLPRLQETPMKIPTLVIMLVIAFLAALALIMFVLSPGS